VLSSRREKQATASGPFLQRSHLTQRSSSGTRLGRHALEAIKPGLLSAESTDTVPTGPRPTFRTLRELDQRGCPGQHVSLCPTVAEWPQTHLGLAQLVQRIALGSLNSCAPTSPRPRRRALTCGSLSRLTASSASGAMTGSCRAPWQQSARTKNLRRPWLQRAASG
jgi:hypothetical protein